MNNLRLHVLVIVGDIFSICTYSTFYNLRWNALPFLKDNSLRKSSIIPISYIKKNENY